MKIPSQKTKIVCTIGPASNSPLMMERLLEAGMSVARINMSHGTFDEHAEAVKNLRAAAGKTGSPLAVMADLPGPKMRIGKVASEPMTLSAGDVFKLTTDEKNAGPSIIFVSLPELHKAVRAGDSIFINDGFIHLKVERVAGQDISCRVIVGGEIRSHKGVNVPGVNLGIGAFTSRDRECLEFAHQAGVDAVSLSFVESAADIRELRKAAAGMNYQPFVIAKIERSTALENIDEIIKEADGIMIARGDLGVEMPIERMAFVQKDLVKKANLAGKPVIVATQMLESMTGYTRPTRAEATDVANAVLDGADCVMLSAETAMGKYPVEAAAMLAKISAEAEKNMCSFDVRQTLKTWDEDGIVTDAELLSLTVETAIDHVDAAAVFVPTRSGATARSMTRFRLPVWIIAVSSHAATCAGLRFSYGVFAICEAEHPRDWNFYVKEHVRKLGLKGNIALLTEGPSKMRPDSNTRMEVIRV